MKIKVGDNVVVIAGADKGKTGVVQSIIPKESKIVIEGINVRTIHVKPTQANPEGGIVTQEKPIHISNVMFNAGTAKEIKATKIAIQYEKNKNGRKDKNRIAKINGEKI